MAKIQEKFSQNRFKGIGRRQHQSSLFFIGQTENIPGGIGAAAQSAPAFSTS
jgi:hypothetical protein